MSPEINKNVVKKVLPHGEKGWSICFIQTSSQVRYRSGYNILIHSISDTVAVK